MATIEQMKGITPAQLAALYQRLGSARKVGEFFGIDHGTVAKYLKEQGITLEKPGYTTSHVLRKGLPTFKPGKFARWLRENTDTRLPRSIRGISEISGLSMDVVRGYLWNRLRTAKKIITEKMDPLNKYDLELTATDSNKEQYKVNLNVVTKYYYKIDKFTHQIKISGIVEAAEGDFIVIFEPIDVWDLYLLCEGDPNEQTT